MININYAQHPLRQTAIEIMEEITKVIDKPTIFDCKGTKTTWYDVEDSITNILYEKSKKWRILRKLT